MIAPVRTTAPENITFLPRVHDCFGSSPAINLDGYCMEFLVLPPGAEYPLFRKTVSISVLEGALENPQLQKYETGYYPTTEGKGGLRTIKVEAETLLFLAYDTSERNEKRENDMYKINHILGPNISWIDVEKKSKSKIGPGKRYRTDPKIEIVGNINGRDVHWNMNLWYLVANLNWGIHNHAEDMPKFREFHVQLIGNGAMVKYKNSDPASVYEQHKMEIGKSHPPFWTEEKGVIKYPLHAYTTRDKGAVFAAFEEV